jgi:hypothetical protein
LCSLWGRKWIFKYLDKFWLQKVKGPKIYKYNSEITVFISSCVHHEGCAHVHEPPCVWYESFLTSKMSQSEVHIAEWIVYVWWHSTSFAKFAVNISFLTVSHILQWLLLPACHLLLKLYLQLLTTHSITLRDMSSSVRRAKLGRSAQKTWIPQYLNLTGKQH